MFKIDPTLFFQKQTRNLAGILLTAVLLILGPLFSVAEEKKEDPPQPKSEILSQPKKLKPGNSASETISAPQGKVTAGTTEIISAPGAVKPPENSAPKEPVAEVISAPSGKSLLPKDKEVLKAPTGQTAVPPEKEVIKAPSGKAPAPVVAVTAEGEQREPAAEVLSAPKGTQVVPESSEIIKKPSGSTPPPAKALSEPPKSLKPLDGAIKSPSTEPAVPKEILTKPNDSVPTETELIRAPQGKSTAPSSGKVISKVEDIKD